LTVFYFFSGFLLVAALINAQKNEMLRAAALQKSQRHKSYLHDPFLLLLISAPGDTNRGGV
jgi:hypothetical protein